MIVIKRPRPEYVMAMENPYKEEIDALGLAKKLIDEGRTNQAILALESHLAKNETDFESWRMLGILHQEND